MTKAYCDPELQRQIEGIVSGKMAVNEKDYVKILGSLWAEFKVRSDEDTRIIKSRDRIVEMLQLW